MQVTITLDYPDELIERFGASDAVATLAARLEEVYPGDDGDVLVMGTGLMTPDPVNSDVRERQGPALRIRVGDLVQFASADGIADDAHPHDLGLPPVADGDVSYHAWSDGRAVGYRATCDGKPDEYVYLNPSDRDQDEKSVPDVFVYWGRHGDPNGDNPVTYLPVQCGVFATEET